jgi:formylglycine-generating enzyme required for sulfatase activity
MRGRRELIAGAASAAVALVLLACNALTGASDLGTCAEGDCASLGAPARAEGGADGATVTGPDGNVRVLPATCTGNESACSGKLAAQCMDGQWQTTTCAETCVGGKCTAHPSCRNAAGTGCGAAPGASDLATSCCAAALVPGGTYNRRNQIGSPATVSPFQLDLYEVTVGRMRAFVDAGAATKSAPPLPGAGAHPKIANSGWQPAWDVLLPEDGAALRAGLNRFSGTWTDAPGANEHRPINNVSWFVAFAFCAWDGARLPTYTEANFAAAGGSEQRLYPWSAPPGSTSVDPSRAAYDCAFSPPSQSCPASFCSDDSSSPCDPATCVAPASCQYPSCTGCALADVADVGKLTAGVGRYGHFDLSGNVAEMVLDIEGFLTPGCTDCARVPPSQLKQGGKPRLDVYFVTVGGGWSHSPFSMRTASASSVHDDALDKDVGFRCAR